MGLRNLVYGAYERRLAARLPAESRPAARRRDRSTATGGGPGPYGADTQHGHRAGADKILELLGWCEDVGVEVVTLWLLSTDNLNRPAAELDPAAADHRGRRRRTWPATGAGGCTWSARSTCCPPPPRAGSRSPPTRPATVDGLHVNIAVGYGGRREIADAVRSLLQEQAARGTSIEELAEVLDVEHIAEHLYTKGQPDPDLVIRTSGEQRLSAASCSGRARTASSTSARRSGPTSGTWTSCGRCAPTPSASAGSAPERRPAAVRSCPGTTRRESSHRAATTDVTYDLTRGTCPAFGRPPDGAIAAPGGGPAPAPPSSGGAVPAPRLRVGTVGCAVPRESHHGYDPSLVDQLIRCSRPHAHR